MKRLLAILSAGLATAAASADTNPWLLSGGSLSQNWSNTGLITTSDDWSGVPSITGYRGDDPAGTVTGVDPQTQLGDWSGVIDVNANNTNPNTFTTGGVAEFDTLPDPTVALQGSGTADNTNLVLYLNTTGMMNIFLSFNARDIDGSADNAVQQIAVHYRVGGVGTYTNVPGGYIADASTGPSLATLVTPISVTDPALANQALVELRIMTTNAIGSDEWIGIDDINVSGTPIPEPTSLALIALGGLMLMRRR